MAQQRLHHAQVGAVVQQVAGEGVAQDVRADARAVDAAQNGERLQLTGKMLAGEVAGFAE